MDKILKKYRFFKKDDCIYIVNKKIFLKRNKLKDCSNTIKLFVKHRMEK